MKFSIVTTSFNSSATIADALESVRIQNWTNIEHIVIDGASTDSTLAVVERYPHVSNIVSEPDCGMYHAMNKGIDLATGDVVMILNSDDMYEGPSVIEKYASLFEKTGCDSAYANLVYVDRFDTNKICRYWKSKPYARDHFIFGWMPPHPTFAIKRKKLLELGSFNTNLKSAADYELMLRLLYKHNLTAEFLDTTTIKMRLGGQSNASLKNRLFAHYEDRQAWKINKLRPRFYTLYAKPLSKLPQLITD